MPFNIGLPELMIVLVIALIVLGPKKLPDAVAFPQVRAALDALRDETDAVALLVEVERRAHDVQRAAIAALREAANIQLVATMLAAEASHLVAWRTVR